MKTILMTCLLVLCAACSTTNVSNNDPMECHLASYNLGYAPQFFLICEGDIVAECFADSIPTGFRWNGYYCRNDDPSAR